ncbi:uncharacterized protein EI90DRAFT_3034072 [Cantharellus anzutake]|uniref:uncharacterized protein n=1 Tax=Cantharellus anzutake TaxID=1750568 RepID=UPI001906486D|nr:uncharacterized protein EI90DRAFT_3034072 [Cantharellus anzutake]KAF8341477.1 hypothetical protein EI90DRAFT_3034072 [Cantharellus anzutake]
MSRPDDRGHSSSPQSIRIDMDHSLRREDGGPRRSPTMMRAFDDEDARERQRQMDVDSALQLSRSRSTTLPIPGQQQSHSILSHSLSSGPSPNSPPLRGGMGLMDHDFPTLSEAEERDMQLARGGNGGMGPSLADYPYRDEPEASDINPDVIHTDPLDAEPPPHLGGHSTILHHDLRVNFHDPMLDPPPVRRRNTLTVPYSPHDPVIGSLGTHDPPAAGYSNNLLEDQSFEHTNAVSQDVTSRPEVFRYSEATASHHQLLSTNPPVYQPAYRSNFDYSLIERFAAQERAARSAARGVNGSAMGAEIRRRLAESSVTAPKESGDDAFRVQKNMTIAEGDLVGNTGDNIGQETPDGFLVNSSPALEEGFVQKRQRKLSQSNPNPRRQAKLAMFEGGVGLPLTSQPTPPSHLAPGGASPGTYGVSSARANFFGHSHRSGTVDSAHDRPYRFSFYSNAMAQTIHARSLSEIPAEGQSFEDLFFGRSNQANVPSDQETPSSGGISTALHPNGMPNSFNASISSHPTPLNGRPVRSGMPAEASQPKPKEGLFSKHPGRTEGHSSPAPGGAIDDDQDRYTWWLDVLSPTDDEMKMFSGVFNIHPLTTEDILMEEAREKIELFRNYYFVCFRGFDQDVYSPTHLEPLNMYIVVFREGVLSFHFRPSPHPQSVRRRIKQLRDYINVTADWISYALIDDITDAFGPLIQNIEYEVDSIDELVLILKDAEQTDMLRRIGTCRKKVMGLLRLMGNKADVVKGLAKRCNENWSVAPKSDIGLYLSDIQDHLVTMTQNLNHYEKILSRSHSNYLAQISIEMTDANNQINDVLSKLTALGTVLIPMNLITGLWGMNVHVPGQDVAVGYTWFLSIIGGLVGFGIIGFFAASKLLVSR